jgi:hypothetical protein
MTFINTLAKTREGKKELIKLSGSLNDFPDKYSQEEFLEEDPGKLMYNK